MSLKSKIPLLPFEDEQVQLRCSFKTGMFSTFSQWVARQSKLHRYTHRRELRQFTIQEKVHTSLDPYPEQATCSRWASTEHHMEQQGERKKTKKTWPRKLIQMYMKNPENSQWSTLEDITLRHTLLFSQSLIRNMYVR